MNQQIYSELTPKERMVLSWKEGMLYQFYKFLSKKKKLKGGTNDGKEKTFLFQHLLQFRKF